MHTLLGNVSKMKGGLIYASVIVVLILCSLIIPNFFTSANLKAILISMVLVTVLAVGVTFVHTVGEIDIAAGAVLSIPACIFAVLSNHGVSTILSLLIGIVITIILGFFNGFITIKFGVPSFITTLGSMGIAMGLSRIVSNNSPVSVHDDFITRSFGGDILGLPKEIVWMLVLVILGHFLLHKTQFGKNLNLVGDNREASRLYGVSINKSVIWAFVISALFAAFAGMLEVARSAFASPGAGEPYLLTAIVASVIGGTSLQGGKGSIIGAFFGGIFLTIISNALFRLGIAPWVANVITGVVILVILTGGGMVNRLKRTAI